MESILEALANLYFRLKLGNREQAMTIYRCCEVLCAAIWVALAISMTVTSGNSFTFNFEEATIFHLYLLTTVVVVSLIAKLYLVAATAR